MKLLQYLDSTGVCRAGRVEDESVLTLTDIGGVVELIERAVAEGRSPAELAAASPAEPGPSLAALMAAGSNDLNLDHNVPPACTAYGPELCTATSRTVKWEDSALLPK